jgi:hypothetical protein
MQAWAKGFSPQIVTCQADAATFVRLLWNTPQAVAMSPVCPPLTVRATADGTRPLQPIRFSPSY